MIGRGAFSYVRIRLVSLSLACMGAMSAWGCVNTPQSNCPVPPGLNTPADNPNVGAAWKKAGAGEFSPTYI
jgi:hypothetical protein